MKYGHSHLLKLLVDFGGNVNDPGTSGNYPLTVAVANGYIQCVEELYQLGADIHVRDIIGDTLLHKAVLLTDESIIIPMIKLLLKLGIDFNIKNNDSNTALKSAYLNNNSLAVELLGGRTGVVSDLEIQNKL